MAGLVVALTLVLLASSTPAATLSTLPSGFEDQVVFTGLVSPTNIRFSPDGRVFVAEKSGLIKVYDSLSDPTPDVFADLRTNVYNFWDRGLLGLALAPGFPATPYVYVLYTYDHVLGDPALPPKWGTPGATSDPCPSPPGATSDGCVVSARLSRLQASGNSMVGSEQVLIEDWCQQYPSHSIGTIEFGADGALYVGGGDGASFSFIDWGQDGNPLNPCGDPPAGVGGTETPPTAEGGALRSQDLRTPADPVSLDGAILRVDATGNPLPDNPLISNPDANAKRIIAYGLRNPFRFTTRPGTNELWVGDVGAGGWEEIDRIPNPSDATVENFGWPCYEGPGRQPGFDSADLNICENLYADPQADTKPYFNYAHADKVVPGETCPTGSSSVSGLSFAFSGGSSPYPSAYDNALFFADYSRNCIWVMKKGANGLPAPGLIDTFVADAAAPVDLERAPNGEIYYADFTGGTIHRIHFAGTGGGTPYSDTVLADNPQLYWRLGQTSGNFSDASGHGNDGLGGGTGILRGQADLLSANTDGSVKFTDAVSNITIGAPTGLSSIALSTEAWFKTGAHANWIDLASHNWGGAGGQGWSLFTDATGALYFGLWQGGGPQQLISVPGLQLNTAYHAVGTYDGNVMRLYLNGALAASKTVGALSLNTTASIFSGRVDTTAGVFVDELAVYATALSASRVQAHYAAASGGTGGNQAPTATIATPAASLTWKVGDQISFSGQATDPEDGTLPASALHWDVILHHCPSNCHTHVVQTFDDVTGGSFAAPDHEYPSYIEIKLTATDSQNATGTASVSVQPKTVTVTLASQPTGLQLSLNSTSAAAPFTQTVIQGSTNTISAPGQTLNGTTYAFVSWSDSGAASHNVVANANATYTATYQASSTPAYVSTVLADNPLLYWELGEPSGAFGDTSGHSNVGTAGGTGLSRHAADLVAGLSDGALKFTDGTSNVTCSSPSGLPSAAVSVEVWFKAVGFANFIDLVSHNWGGTGGSGWSMYVTNSRQLWWGLKEGSAAETSVKVGSLNANTVYHAVGTYDGNVLRLYLNGSQVATKTVGAKTLNTTASVFTGKTDTTAGVTVDELALYSGALSATRVQAHHTAGS